MYRNQVAFIEIHTNTTILIKKDSGDDGWICAPIYKGVINKRPVNLDEIYLHLFYHAIRFLKEVDHNGLLKVITKPEDIFHKKENAKWFKEIGGIEYGDETIFYLPSTTLELVYTKTCFAVNIHWEVGKSVLCKSTNVLSVSPGPFDSTFIKAEGTKFPTQAEFRQAVQAVEHLAKRFEPK